MNQVPEGYLYACRVDEIPPRGKKAVRVGDRDVLLIACDENLFAIENSCPQTGRSMAHGRVSDCYITSPNTGARYDLHTGQYAGRGFSPLSSHWLSVFSLRVIGEKVYVRV
ncbi:MAG: nitrite reductase (NAD(P)H) small subunit [Anaerolineae bacterium]|jgi:nitrite reductase/ring-hydroxylating ferredoxin subunit|nr:nitrite reductase (NAD(P)H) small subunit [Anaerolineae bacterium]